MWRINVRRALWVSLIVLSLLAAGLFVVQSRVIPYTPFYQHAVTGCGCVDSDSLSAQPGYKVLDRIGDRANETGVLQGTIQRIYIKVTIGADSPSMDMNTTLITVTDAVREVTLNFTATGGPTATLFNCTELRDPLREWADNGAYIVSEGSVVTICIDVNATGLSLPPSTPVTVRIIPRYGPTTLEQFAVPEGFTYRYVDFY